MSLTTQLKNVFPSSRNEIFKKINSYRSEGTHADEWLRLFKFFLLPIAVLFTVVFGFAIHYNLALPYVGHYGALLCAVLLTAFLEWAKIVAMRGFFRDLFFGLFRQGISTALIMVIGFFISLGAFMWSYDNSTQGVQYIAKYLGETMVHREVVQTNTSELDAKIESTLHAKDAGLNTKWKGTTTQDGQKIALTALAVQAEQEKQKTLLLEQDRENQQKKDGHREEFINRVGILLSFLGGKMEFFQIALIIGIVLSEHALFGMMKNGGGTTTPGGKKSTRQASKFDEFVNGTEFGTEKAVNGLPKNQTPGTVSQCDTDFKGTTGTQAHTTISMDDKLRYSLYKIRRDVPNLKNENGLPASIMKRITDELLSLNTSFKFVENARPSQEVARDFLEYVNTECIPAAARAGQTLVIPPALENMLSESMAGTAKAI